MTPVWVDSAVRAFGKRVGFADFALNDRGVASATFENGIALAFEFVAETLCVSLRVPARPTAVTAKKLLVAAHPSNRYPFHLRTAYLEKRGQVLFLVRLGERQVTPTAIDEVFSGLWNLATRLGGDR